MYLVVYADDFKMSDPAAKMKEALSLVREGLRIVKPQPLGKYMCCHHV